MSDFDRGMQALRRRFAASLGDHADTLEKLRADGAWGDMLSIAHGLAGRSGMFGYEVVGMAARDLEERIEAGAAEATLEDLLDRLVLALRTGAQER